MNSTSPVDVSIHAVSAEFSSSARTGAPDSSSPNVPQKKYRRQCLIAFP
jgi:hypothetical protein